MSLNLSRYPVLDLESLASMTLMYIRTKGLE